MLAVLGWYVVWTDTAAAAAPTPWAPATPAVLTAIAHVAATATAREMRPVRWGWRVVPRSVMAMSSVELRAGVATIGKRAPGCQRLGEAQGTSRRSTNPEGGARARWLAASRAGREAAVGRRVRVAGVARIADVDVVAHRELATGVGELAGSASAVAVGVRVVDRQYRVEHQLHLGGVAGRGGRSEEIDREC